MSPFDIIELAADLGVLVNEERNFPELVRVRLLRNVYVL